MYMIRDSWKLLHLFCGKHEKLEELCMETTSRGIFYVCPHKKAGRPCMTQITQDEYEAILLYLSNMIVQAEMDGEVLDITNTKWRVKKRILCQVLLYETDRIHVLVECKY